MTLVPRTPKIPRTPKSQNKLPRTPKSSLKTPKSLKAPRTLKTPKRSLAGRCVKTPRSTAKAATFGNLVFEAVDALNDRRGTSFHSIKKYLRDSKKIDVDRKAIFIKKHLKALVDEGKLVQVAGTGANGTFKLPGKKTTSEKLVATSTKSKKVAKVTAKPKLGKVPASKNVSCFVNKISEKQPKVLKKAMKGSMTFKRRL